MIAERWGVTPAEVARSYPCDELMPRAAFQVWRGVTVETSAAVLWPRIVQLRLAPYSYDWVDNLGHRSPRELRPLADPVPGDPFSAVAGRPVGRVLAVDPGVHLTVRIMGTTGTYQLVPDGPDRTRLILKLAGPGRRLVTPLLSVGDLVMARRQLLNLKALAEGDVARSAT